MKTGRQHLKAGFLFLSLLPLSLSLTLSLSMRSLANFLNGSDSVRRNRHRVDIDVIQISRRFAGKEKDVT